MNYERINISELMGLIPDKHHPLYNLCEAIKREGYFMRHINEFTKRELYIMMDIAYRPKEQSGATWKAVDQMLERHGID